MVSLHLTFLLCLTATVATCLDFRFQVLESSEGKMNYLSLKISGLEVENQRVLPGSGGGVIAICALSAAQSGLVLSIVCIGL